MRNLNEIIVHCAATPEGKDFTVKDIDSWHRERGFDGIGYHYVVYRNGDIVDGRSIEKAGAHCQGHNANSVGICYIGGCAADGKTAKDTRTPEQKESLIRLIKDLKSRYPSIVRVSGHREYANKDCPCFDAHAEYQQYV